MLEFVFYNPTKIVFGKNQTERIGEFIKEKKCLFLYGGGSIFKNKIYEKVVKSLKTYKKEWIEKGGVKPNPVLSFVYETIELARKEKIEAILAVGGGSVIDTAKTVAVGYFYEGDVWDFFIKKADPQKALPVYVILTLAATGTEMNRYAVITNEKTKQKFNIDSECVYPVVSILDPVNTYTVPKEQVAYGCVDAMLHLLEGYFTQSYSYTPIQDGFVETLVKVLMETTLKIFEDPQNYDARASFMWATTLALNGLTTAGIGSFGFPNHIIAHSLSAFYDLPHGETLAIVFPAWLKYKFSEKRERISQLGKAIFKEDNPEKVIEKIENFYTSLGVATRLSQVKVPDEDIPALAENAYSFAKVRDLEGYTPEVIAEILKLAK